MPLPAAPQSRRRSDAVEHRRVWRARRVSRTVQWFRRTWWAVGSGPFSPSCDGTPSL